MITKMLWKTSIFLLVREWPWSCHITSQVSVSSFLKGRAHRSFPRSVCLAWYCKQASILWIGTFYCKGLYWESFHGIEQEIAKITNMSKFPLEIHKLSHLILTAILRSRCRQLRLHEGALLFYSRDSIAHSETLFYIWKVLLYFFFFFCSSSKHLFTTYHMLNRKDTNMAKPPG